MTDRKLEHGLLIICPLCGDPLANSQMGVKSHMASHVRKGDLAEADRSDTELKMRGKKRIYPKNESTRKE